MIDKALMKICAGGVWRQNLHGETYTVETVIA